VNRGHVRASELRQQQLFGEEQRTIRVHVRLTSFEAARLDAIAALRGVSRSEALREAISWLAARQAHWAERARQAQAARFLRDSDEWDPVSDLLATGERPAADAARAEPGAQALRSSPRAGSRTRVAADANRRQRPDR
jgi:hypothetical protein